MQTIRNGNKKFQKGILIVEILIAIAIIASISATIFGVVAIYLQTSGAMKETVQANMLAQEAMEATRSFRDGKTWSTDGLGTLSVDPVYYHPIKIGTSVLSWDLALDEENIDGFKRKVVFYNVQRDDVNKNIVSEGGTIDPNTKKVVATVSWKNKNVELVAYLTNWK